MGRMPWATYLWPGLPSLWRRGSWPALVWALGFAILLNLTLVVSVIWSDFVSSEARGIAWAVVGLVWIGSWIASRRMIGRDSLKELEEPTETVPSGFAQAAEYYLKGNWFEAECALVELLRQNPRDLEAGLMLATLLRHTGRLEEAANHLGRLERFEGSRKWTLEIRRERTRIEAAQAAGKAETAPSGAPQEDAEGSQVPVEAEAA